MESNMDMFNVKSFMDRTIAGGLDVGSMFGHHMSRSGRGSNNKYGKMGKWGPTDEQVAMMLRDRGIKYR